MGVFQEYSETQILQMIGRAGRPQVFPFVPLEINQQRSVQLEHLLILFVSKSPLVYLLLVCRLPKKHFFFQFYITFYFQFDTSATAVILTTESNKVCQITADNSLCRNTDFLFTFRESC